jgi:hypothetical protein
MIRSFDPPKEKGEIIDRIRMTTQNKLLLIRGFQQYFSYIVVEETGVPGENHQSAASHQQTIT